MNAFSDQGTDILADLSYDSTDSQPFSSGGRYIKQPQRAHRLNSWLHSSSPFQGRVSTPSRCPRPNTELLRKLIRSNEQDRQNDNSQSKRKYQSKVTADAPVTSLLKCQRTDDLLDDSDICTAYVFPSIAESSDLPAVSTSMCQTVHDTPDNLQLPRRCIIDSGCSTTVLPSKHMFDGGLFKAARPISIISADSNSDIKCHYLGNSGPFHHAMWIPRSEQILVSMGDLDAFGITIEINGGLLRAFYGDRQIFEVRKANNVWMCNFDKLCSKIIANLPSRTENGVTLYGNQQLRPMALVSARSDSDEELFKLLHRRLCHRNMRDILRAVMTKRIYVGKGFASLITNVKSTIATYDSKCDACEKAKSHTQPHPSRNQPEASREPHTRLSQQD